MKNTAMLKSSPERVQQAAEEAFSSGLYCAESVVHALAQAHGIASELLPKMATGFCSGMARTGGPCGALTGAIMGVGLSIGRSTTGETVQATYAVTQKLVHEFESKFGARNCDALLGCDLATQEGQAKFKQDKLHERCRRYTGHAAEMAARLLSQAHS